MSTFSERLRFLIETHAEGKHTVFGKKAGIPKTTMQGYVDGRLPKFNHLVRIQATYGVNLHWLMIGEGEVYNKDRKDGIVAEDQQDYLAPSPLSSDSVVIQMAREILSSESHYGASLEANIRSFHRALETERKIDDLENRLARIEREKMEKEARIRAGDPIEQKEEFLRKRDAGLLP